MYIPTYVCNVFFPFFSSISIHPFVLSYLFSPIYIHTSCIYTCVAFVFRFFFFLSSPPSFYSHSCFRLSFLGVKLSVLLSLSLCRIRIVLYRWARMCSRRTSMIMEVKRLTGIKPSGWIMPENHIFGKHPFTRQKRKEKEDKKRKKLSLHLDVQAGRVVVVVVVYVQCRGSLLYQLHGSLDASMTSWGDRARSFLSRWWRGGRWRCLSMFFRSPRTFLLIRRAKNDAVFLSFSWEASFSYLVTSLTGGPSYDTGHRAILCMPVYHCRFSISSCIHFQSIDVVFHLLSWFCLSSYQSLSIICVSQPLLDIALCSDIAFPCRFKVMDKDKLSKDDYVGMADVTLSPIVYGTRVYNSEIEVGRPNIR